VIVTKPFSCFQSTPYKDKVARFIGPKGHKCLLLSEKFFASPIYKSWVLMQHGPDHELKKFRAELYAEEDDQDTLAFRLNLEKEKEYTEFLAAKGVIKQIPKWRENVSTAARIAANAALAGFTAPISLPAGAVGIATRAATQNRMNDVTCLQPTTTHAWDGEAHLKIFQSNIACTEFNIMDRHNLVPKTKSRVKNWARHLLRVDADIICLQEAFDFYHILPKIGETLRENGYYVMLTTKRAEVFGMTGGLMLAVRLGEVSYVGYEEYTDRVSLDKRAAKGVLAATIQLNDETKICVATTHMQAGYPKGWTVDDKIALKAAQFQRARRFIQNFVADQDMSDIFLIGDFNDSRFTQLNEESLDQVILDPEYSAIVDGLLRPKENENGFKDLTVPNVDDSFSTYLEKEAEFDPDAVNEERGIPKGTCFNTAATSYHYFVDLVSHLVADETGLSPNKVKKMVKKQLAGKCYLAKIDEVIKELQRNMYVKSNAVDHITMMESDTTIFSPVGYAYGVKIYNHDTDHVSLLMEIKPHLH